MQRVSRVAALAAALFVFGFGQQLWFRYLPEYLRALGVSAVGVGLFGAWKDLLDAAYAYPGGVLSDRLGTRRALLSFGTLTALGVGVLWIWPATAGVFVGLLLVMAWPSLGLPATFSLIGEDLRGGQRVRGFTAQAILKRLPIVLAPPLGGLMIERLGMRSGMRVGFLISFGLSLAMLAGLSWALLHRAPPVVRARMPPPSAERVRLRPALARLLAADCLIRLCEGLPEVFLVVWAIEIVRVSPSQFGFLISVMMATAIASYFPAAALAERVEKKPFILLTYVFFSLFPVAVLASKSFPHLLLAYAIGGLREIGEPARKALIVDLSDPRTRGRTVGLYYAIRGFAVAGAAGVGGLLWTIRPALTFVAAAGLGILGTIWAAVSLPASSGLEEKRA